MAEENSTVHSLGVPLAIVVAGALIAGAVYFRTPATPGAVTVPAEQAVNLDDRFLGYAEVVGADRAQVERCLADGTSKAAITADQQAGVAAGVTGTPSFIVAGERIDGAVPLAEFEKTIDAALSGKKGALTPSISEDDPVLGSPSAPVTMVEFSDFECPFCQQFHTATWPQLKAKYIDTGKVRYIYKDFPLANIHPHAQRAAEAAACMATQGKFWEYADTLFTNQAEWKK